MKSIALPSLEKNLHDFLRPFEKDLARPARRQLLRMVKGMIEGKTVKLAEIGRTIRPDIMPKTFCEALGKFLEKIENPGEIQLKKLQKFKYLLVDETDVERWYAKKIEGIQVTWNGSAKRPGRGYNLLSVVGKDEEDRLTPVILERFEEKGFGRENVIKKYIEAHGPDHGACWIADRGWDDGKIFKFMIENHQEFLIRLDGKKTGRLLEMHGPEGVETWTVSRLCEGMGKVAYRRVFLPKRKEMLTLIQYHHGKKEPLYLLTTKTPKTQIEAEKIAREYLGRWDIENYFRFVKQHFYLEDLMLQNIDRVDSMLQLVLIASSFLMKYLPNEDDRTTLALLYLEWLKQEHATISSASFARFCSDIFTQWNLNFRIIYRPPDPHQLNLFPT